MTYQCDYILDMHNSNTRNLVSADQCDYYIEHLSVFRYMKHNSKHGHLAAFEIRDTITLCVIGLDQLLEGVKDLKEEGQKKSIRLL